MALKDWMTRLRGKPEESTPEPPAAHPVQAPPPALNPPTPPELFPPAPPPDAPVPLTPTIPAAPAATFTREPPPPPEIEPSPEPLPARAPTGPSTLRETTPPPAPPSPAARETPPAPGEVARAPAAPPPAPPDTTPAPPASDPGTAAPEEAPARTGWFSRLKAGLARSTARLTESVTALLHKRRLDDAALEELEETLIAADLGVAAAARIVAGFRRTRFGKEVTDEEVKAALAEEIAAILDPVASPMPIERGHAPHVVLVVGVNGTGKTTTIAKLGQQYREQGLSTGFVAGDTFRAAAVEQLQIWGERTGARVYAPAKPNADAAGLAFDALTAAKAEVLDVLLVDTAGRLHNKTALMEELRKVVRVLRRVDPTAPHSVLLVLDATTGQNAIQQCKVFKEMVEVTGLAVTKLDGSAKGGVVVALAQEFAMPVHFVGVGEKAGDLRPFTARDFARGLVGLD